MLRSIDNIGLSVDPSKLVGGADSRAAELAGQAWRLLQLRTAHAVYVGNGLGLLLLNVAELLFGMVGTNVIL